MGKEKHGVVLSSSLNKEAKEKQKAGRGFDSCSASTSLSHGTVM